VNPPSSLIPYVSLPDVEKVRIAATFIIKLFNKLFFISIAYIWDRADFSYTHNDETIVFSWIEWPDKAIRDAAMSKMGEMTKSDDRMNPEKNPMPFDGKRMIFGGFTPVVELGAAK
jgi:hypothetical protein